MILSTTDRYLAGVYESGIDEHLDMDALRVFLLAKGIRRTPYQVIADLRYYGFVGYIATHPAPEVPN